LKDKDKKRLDKLEGDLRERFEIPPRQLIHVLYETDGVVTDSDGNAASAEDFDDSLPVFVVRYVSPGEATK